MKSISNFLYNLTLFSIFSLCCSNQSFGQEKVNISAGVGFAEFLNVGVRYQLKQAQIGISLGSLPRKEGSLISVSGDYYGHFAGSSKLSNRRPWYGRAGLNYIRDEDSTHNDKYVYLNFRFGRDINISKKLGIQIDAGINFQLYYENVSKLPPSSWDIDIDYSNSLALPSIGIGLFYRI